MSAASFLPVGDSVVVALRLGGFALLLVTFVFALLNLRLAQDSPRRRLAVGASVTAVAVIFALVAYVAVRPAHEGAPVPTAFALNLSESGVSQVSERTVTPDSVDQEHAMDVAVQLDEQGDEVEGGAGNALVTAAQDAGYEPRSGLSPDWDAAMVTEAAGIYFVTVPLLGTDIPELTKVVFSHDNGTTTVVEMSARFSDVAHAQLDVWQNGAHTDAITAENPELMEADGSVAQVGWWDRLNSCLSSAGIHWAVITLVSAACAAACVVTAGTACLLCISAVIGGSSGTIAGCIQQASRG
jgi:hypothetical protein